MIRPGGRNAGDAVPEQIVRTLKRLILRARLVIAVRGLLAVTAVAGACLLSVMAIDAAVTIFAQWVRMGLSCAALGATVVAALWLLVRPLAHSLSLEGVARAIESHHPELQERISSAVELLRSGDDADLRGSPVLIAELVRRASNDVRSITPRREITFRRARPALAGTLALACLLGVLWLAWPARTSRLLLRAVAPHLNLPNVSAGDLTVDPGDTVVTRGRALRVEVAVASPAVRSAEFRTAGPDGRDAVAPMARIFDADTETPRFAFTCPPGERDFRYRIHAGDAVSRYYAVEVVPFPAVTRVDLHYDYPDYTGLPDRDEADARGDVEAVGGTTVTVRARANTAVRNARLLVDGRELPDVRTETAPAEGETDCVFRFVLPSDLAGRWHVALTDVYGFANSPAEHDIRALPDEAPSALIVEPEHKRLRLKPDDRLPVAYAVADDYGVARAELLLETDRGELPPQPVMSPAGDAAPRTAAEGVATLNLSSLDLAGARKLTFRLRATDGLPGGMDGPQHGLSAAYTIEIDRGALTYAEQALQLWEETIREGLEGLLESLAAAKEASTKALPQVAEPGDLSPDAREQVDEMLASLDDADAAARDLARQMEWSVFSPMAEELTDVADEQISRAQDMAAQAQIMEEPEERLERADEADFRIDMATAAVSDMLGDLDAVTEAARRRMDLADLADEQSLLADLKQAMEAAGDEPSPMSADMWGQQQAAMAGDVDEAFAESVQDSLRARRPLDLAARARSLEKEQRSLAETTRHLGKIQEIDATLLRLAEEQEALSHEAGQDELSAPQTERMADAAGLIRAEDLDNATLQQSEAAGQLGGRARSLQEELTRTQLTARVDAMARRQRELADRAAASEEPIGPQDWDPAGRQAAIIGELDKLQEEARQGGWQTDQLFRRHDPKARMGQTSEAAQALRAAQAVATAESPAADLTRVQLAQVAGQAAETVEKLSEELHKVMERHSDLEDKEQRTEQLNGLAERQRDLERRTRDYGRRQREEMARFRSAQVERLQDEQQSAALEAAQLAGRTPPVGAEEETEDAARQANRAARRLQADRLPEAAELAADTADRLADLAQSPAAAPERERVERMAERQRRLAAQMDMLAETQNAELTAGAQDDLLARTDDLSQDVRAVRDLLTRVVPGSTAATEATGAATHTEEAVARQLAAEKAIAETRTPEAIDPQYESASALNSAAGALERMEQHLAEAVRSEDAGAVPPSEEAGHLAQASEAAGQAAQQLQSQPAAQAAEHLRAAAAMAEGRAQRMGLRPMTSPRLAAAMPGFPFPMGDPRGRRAPDMRDLSPPDLEAMGISPDEWMRLPGELRSDILQGGGTDAPPEYRALIKRYFRALARQGTPAQDAPRAEADE